MWLGCAGPGPAAYDDYNVAPKPYNYVGSRAPSPLPIRGPPAYSRRPHGSFEGFDGAPDVNHWSSHDMKEANQWNRLWQAETQRLRQEVMDLQMAEHGTVLRAHLQEQQVLSELRAMEHYTTLQVSKDVHSVEERAAAKLQQAVASEAQRASDMQSHFLARIAATNAEAAAAHADASMRRADAPRLEAQAVAAAQRLSNARMEEADRRTAEATAARECCEKMVLKQLGELQEHAAANAELASAKDHMRIRMQNLEELNTRLSHRLMDAEEINIDLKYRLHLKEETEKLFKDSLKRADPVLAAELSGEIPPPQGPQRTAAALEAENSALRNNLLEATQMVEELTTQKESLETELYAERSRLQRKDSKSSIKSDGSPGRRNSVQAPPQSTSPRRLAAGNSPRQTPGFGTRSLSPRNNSARNNSARVSARTANSSARSFNNAGSARSSLGSSASLGEAGGRAAPSWK